MSAIIQGGGDVFGPIGATDGNIPVFDGTSGKIIKDSGMSIALPRNYLTGLGLSNNGSDAVNDIDIAVGDCRDSTNTQNITLAAPLTKRLDANWVVGTGQGGLDTGAVANGTYHVHLIKRVDTGVVDALFSGSATAPTLPANYTHFRRVGSILRAAGAINAFFQYGDRFILGAQVTSFNTTTAFAKALLVTTVPGGIVTFPILFAAMTQNAAGASVLTFYPGSGATNNGVFLQVRLINQSGNLIVEHLPTNTSSQIYVELTIIGTLTACIFYTVGWVDRRDQ